MRLDIIWDLGYHNNLMWCKCFISLVLITHFLLQHKFKKSHKCELSDAGCATALVAGLMSHTMEP